MFSPKSHSNAESFHRKITFLWFQSRKERKAVLYVSVHSSDCTAHQPAQMHSNYTSKNLCLVLKMHCYLAIFARRINRSIALLINLYQWLYHKSSATLFLRLGLTSNSDRLRYQSIHVTIFPVNGHFQYTLLLTC